MVAEARELAQIHEWVAVKIPMTPDGLKATRILAEEDIRVNVTLIFQPLQALLAAKAGAAYVSPFIGRLDDISHRGMEIVEQIITIFENYGFDTEIIVASVRHPLHVLEGALAGADIATIPYGVMMQLLKHPLTDIGLTKVSGRLGAVPASPEMHQVETNNWGTPNMLTGARIAAVPVVMLLLCFPGRWASFFGGLCFVLAGATDFLDGFLARRHRLVSRLGKFMDPLADKLLVSAALIMLIPLGRVPAWMAFLIVGRELAVTGLRGLAAAEGIILAPDRWGKAKTLLQMAALTALILHYPYDGIDFHRVGMVAVMAGPHCHPGFRGELFSGLFPAVPGKPTPLTKRCS